MEKKTVPGSNCRPHKSLINHKSNVSNQHANIISSITSVTTVNIRIEKQNGSVIFFKEILHICFQILKCFLGIIKVLWPSEVKIHNLKRTLHD